MEIDYSDNNNVSFQDWYLSISEWLTATSKIAVKEIGDTPAEQLEVLDALSIQLVYLGKLRATAQYYLDEATGRESEKLIEQYADKKVTPSQIAQIVKGRIAIYKKAHNNIERLGATIVHRIEALRSEISYQKSISKNS